MENKNVGYLILGISIVMIFVIFTFNSALKDIVSSSCSVAGHGDSCPMYDTISRQTNLSLGIVGILILVGLFIMFSKPKEKIIVKTKTIEKKKAKKNINNLEKDEKRIMEFLIGEGNAMFQSDLLEKTNFGKVKLTRLLDKLESKQFIERKRRGMNNIVVVKD